MRSLNRTIASLGIVVGIIMVSAPAQARGIVAGHGLAQVATRTSGPHFATATIVTGLSYDAYVYVSPRWDRVVEYGPKDGETSTSPTGLTVNLDIIDLMHHRVIATARNMGLYGGTLFPDDANGRVYSVRQSNDDQITGIEIFDIRSGRVLSRHTTTKLSPITFYGVDASTGNLFGLYNDEIYIVSPSGSLVARRPFVKDLPYYYKAGPLIDPAHHTIIFYQRFNPNPSTSDEALNPSTVVAYDTRTGQQEWKRSVGFSPGLCGIDSLTGQVWVTAVGGHIRVYDDQSGRLLSDINMAYPVPSSFSPNYSAGLIQQSVQYEMLIDGIHDVGYIYWGTSIDRADAKTHRRTLLVDGTAGVTNGSPKFFLGTNPVSNAVVYNSVQQDRGFDTKRDIVFMDGRTGKPFLRTPVDMSIWASAVDSSHVYIVTYAQVTQTNDISGSSQVSALKVTTVSF